ncbi:MAG: hypothetical protein PSN46_09370 [Gammaproteobacteria bacterium]|nr:hypothetical protein [Gammaproteobacteria bacterium]
METFPPLSETQRIKYLQALGVTSWLPTGKLLGTECNAVLWQQEEKTDDQEWTQVEAAPLQAMQPVAAVPAEEELQSQAQKQAVTNEARGTLKTLIKPDTQTVEPLVSKEVGSAGLASAAPERIAPMHLSLSCYTNGVVVVNDAPMQDGVAMSSPIQRLQTAIVNALTGVDAAQVMPAASIEFNWPLVPGPHGDHTLSGAKSGLLYSLSKLLQQHPCVKLLLMGPGPVRLLQPALAIGDNVHVELPTQPTCQAHAVSSHSLHQLLAVPSLKAETWLHLQPLLTDPSRH